MGKNVKTNVTPKQRSVKSYQQDIGAEKQKMNAYSNKFRGGVRSLQNDFKNHAKCVKKSALMMKDEAIKKMGGKVNQFNIEIKNQMRENKEAVAKIIEGTNFLLNEINKKKRDFKSYARGSFRDYIKAFWG